MKRILFISHTLDFSAGGAERVFHEVVARIDRTRFAPSVFVGGDANGIPQEYAKVDVPIEATKTLILHAQKNPIRLLQTAVSVVSLAFALWRKLGREEFDVAHVNTLFALHFAFLPCMLRGIPVTYHEHGLARDRDHSVWGQLFPFMARRMSHIFAITDAVRGEVLSYGIDPNRVTTVYNGIDASCSKPTIEEAHSDAFRIAQVANFLEWKDHPTVLRALALLRKNVPEARLVLYGQSKNPAYEKSLQEIVAAEGLGDCVEFGGYRNDLMEFLDEFDCLVVASRAEPFGLVLLEAMRADVPVAASNGGGVPEIVTDGENGLLFPPGDPLGLAKALERIAREPGLPIKLRTGGHLAIRERFSFDAQIQKMQALFEIAAR